MKRQADVVVIGAGVIGMFAAYYLSLTGRSVIIVESSSVGAGASGVNLGQLSVLDREPGIQLAWTIESLAILKELEENGEVETELLQSGGLILFGSEEQKEEGLRLMDRQRAMGIPVDYLDREDIRLIEPAFSNPEVIGALYCSLEGSVMPLKMLSTLTETLLRRGVGFSCGNPVTGFRLEGDRIGAVRTRDGEIGARWVVSAAGSWTRELGSLLGLHLPVFYHKGTALVTIPVPRCIRSVIVSGGFLVPRPGRDRIVGLGVAQHMNGSILIGQATERSAGYDRGLSVEGVFETVRNFLRYFPELDGLEIVRVWAGNTTYTPDKLPLFGFSEKVSNLFISAGLKGAFSTAPSAGKMTARLISDKENNSSGTENIELLKPERRYPSHGQSDQL